MYLNLYQTKTSNIYQIKNVKLSSESNADIDHGRSVDRILSITCTSLLNLKKEKKNNVVVMLNMTERLTLRNAFSPVLFVLYDLVMGRSIAVCLFK